MVISFYFVTGIFFLGIFVFLFSHILLIWHRWRQQASQNVQFRYRFDNLEIKEKQRDEKAVVIENTLKQLSKELKEVNFKLSKMERNEKSNNA